MKVMVWSYRLLCSLQATSGTLCAVGTEWMKAETEGLKSYQDSYMHCDGRASGKCQGTHLAHRVGTI